MLGVEWRVHYTLGMELFDQRQAIRHLLDEQNPADGISSYFAFYYPKEKTHLVTIPEKGVRADGYVALSRTGMDLFRPFLTMRLPMHDHQLAAELIYKALPAETAVILNVPHDYVPLLQAFFTVQTLETLKLYVLADEEREPIINVLVTQDQHPNGYPRFMIRAHNDPGRPIGASAGLNWMSQTFAEISVNTNPSYRRRGWGKSVVSKMVEYVLENGRHPLYAVSEENHGSIRLAESTGFVDSGIRQALIQATLRPKPF